jgi:hypothetical protein
MRSGYWSVTGMPALGPKPLAKDEEFRVNRIDFDKLPRREDFVGSAGATSRFRKVGSKDLFSEDAAVSTRGKMVFLEKRPERRG